MFWCTELCTELPYEITHEKKQAHQIPRVELRIKLQSTYIETT